MGIPRRLVLAGAAVVLVFGGIVAVKVSSGEEPSLGAARPLDLAGRAEARPPSRGTAYVEPGPGDQAPHEAENRAGLQPRPLGDEARQRLAVVAQRVTGVLEPLRAKGTATPESVRSALVELGYRADQVGVVWQNMVVFGITTSDGCVQGAVRPERLQVEVAGPSVEWGCLPPGPTH
jgi:hypothetical protein